MVAVATMDIFDAARIAGKKLKRSGRSIRGQPRLATLLTAMILTHAEKALAGSNEISRQSASRILRRHTSHRGSASTKRRNGSIFAQRCFSALPDRHPQQQRYAEPTFVHRPVD